MQPFFFNKNFPFQGVNKGKKLPHTSPIDLNIRNTPEVRNLMLCDFYDKGHLIKDVDKIRRLINQPTCHEYNIRGLIQHVKCKTDAHFGRTESLKINRTPPLHSLDTVCKLFENAKKGSKSYRLEMTRNNPIDYDVKKWAKRLNDDTISLEEIKNTYKLFHAKDLGTKHLDYNIRLSFKTKFKNELSNFAGTDKFCFNCKVKSGDEIKETFLHACYNYPHVHTLINTVSQDFNMGQNLKAKDVLLYKAYPNRKYACVDKNISLAFRCIWMLFYSFINVEVQMLFQTKMSSINTSQML